MLLKRRPILGKLRKIIGHAADKWQYGERLILGAKNVLLDLAKRGIIIRRIIAHSFTPDGIRLMKHIGFTETPPKAPGLRDFMIDIESSGIPFLRAYKEVLKNSLQSAQDQVL